MLIPQENFCARNGRRYTLRTPLAADAEAMLACMKVTAAETEFVTSYPEEITFSAADEAAFLAQLAESPRDAMFCVFDGPTMVGSACVSCMNGRQKTRHRADLGLALRAEVWHLGLGRALISALLAFAKRAGYRQVELEAVAHNTRAIALYESLGFAAFGRRPAGFLLRDGQYADEILMLKTL